MIYTIVLVLFALWTLGMVNSFTLGGFIHLLLLSSLILLVVRLLQRNTTAF